MLRSHKGLIGSATQAIAFAACLSSRPLVDDASSALDVATAPDAAIAPDAFPIGESLHAVRISAGGDSACAVMSDGTVRCWGRNDRGQLANNRVLLSATPVVIAGVLDGVAVSAGRVACALHADGRVTCWGSGSIDPGFCSTAAYVNPMDVGVLDAVGVVSNANGATARLRDGSCAYWDVPSWHQFCTPTQNLTYSTPTLSACADVLGLYGSQCSLANDGSVRCSLDGLPPFVAIQASGARTAACFVTDAANVICSGEILQSLASTPPVTPPPARSIAGLDRILEVRVGSSHACARRDDGAVLCWGHGGQGQLGTGDEDDHDQPILVPGVRDAIQLVVDNGFGCSLDTHGVVSCWGSIVLRSVFDAGRTASPARATVVAF